MTERLTAERLAELGRAAWAYGTSAVPMVPSELLALVDEVEALRGGGSINWQPIETAPKDGSLLILLEPGANYGQEHPFVAVGSWVECGTYVAGGYWDGGPGVMVPTHWVPLDSPNSQEPRL